MKSKGNQIVLWSAVLAVVLAGFWKFPFQASALAIAFLVAALAVQIAFGGGRVQRLAVLEYDSRRKRGLR